uniref:Kynureninase n=1 Tax=Amphora coffeiformis TaxID=265554 RepID=A0A7S3P6I0_9STRA|mmetsp:Transcript_24140/g.45939  ORF Transcript_24140/g.45939 Transcript_24140/m.45939 type:complete len:419 (-) Transcript_24140:257-1513(-)
MIRSCHPRNEAQRRDAQDSLAPLREHFLLPDGKIYLDGNSLGVLPKAVVPQLQTTVTEEWGKDLISSWNTHGWIDLPQKIGEIIAPLVGAGPGQVLCCDSISVNVFKLLSTALALRPGRKTILVEAQDFPTDRYVAEGLVQLLGAQQCCVKAVARDDLEQAFTSDVAVLLLSEVNYRTGYRHDMAALTQSAHAVGAMVCWDVAHSAGAMPIALDEANADFAVGCGYKFLNGGPGSPAFLYVAKRHQNQVSQPLSGWLGHRRPFDFTSSYQPADGVVRYQAGTPSVIAMRALQAALSVFDNVSLAALRQKSLALTDFFLACLHDQPGTESFGLLTPTEDPEKRRGSHVAITHPQGYAIAQALIAEGVIVDFRAPDIIRFGFAPLYNTFQDAARAVTILGSIMTSERYRETQFQERHKVT